MNWANAITCKESYFLPEMIIFYSEILVTLCCSNSFGKFPSNSQLGDNARFKNLKLPQGQKPSTKKIVINLLPNCKLTYNNVGVYLHAKRESMNISRFKLKLNQTPLMPTIRQIIEGNSTKTHMIFLQIVRGILVLRMLLLRSLYWCANIANFYSLKIELA